MSSRLGWLALALALVAGRAGAVSLGVGPSASVSPGDPVSVTIVIAGIGDGGPPKLSGFDIDLAFAPAVLSFVGVSFGDVLGEVGVQALTSADVLSGPTRLNVVEASLLPSETLDAIEPGSFLLATLSFQALAPGVSPLSITRAVLADTSDVPGGNSIAVEAVENASIFVVPEPGTASLLALGLLGIARSRRSR
jgi:hypothetical protein